jgi:hypothetical protein
LPNYNIKTYSSVRGQAWRMNVIYIHMTYYKSKNGKETGQRGQEKLRTRNEDKLGQGIRAS